MKSALHKQILKEQEACWGLREQGYTRKEICDATGLNIHRVKRRLSGAAKAARLDPDLKTRLNEKGITDFAGLHSGWLLDKDKDGSGSSLYFYLGPDEEKIDFVEAITEVLSEIDALAEVVAPKWEDRAKDLCNWLFLADLHVGGDYGEQRQSDDFKACIDDLVSRIPAAEKAVLCELGDLLDANDHKGVTPASGNPTDTVRDNHFFNTMEALRLLKYATYRLLERHQEVELHLIRGNHDETAFFAVLLALKEHYRDNPRVKIFIPTCPEEEEFRVVSWGSCAFFPHHGDKAKPEALKEVFTDQFSDEYAAAKAYRLIATGHLHNLQVKSLGSTEHRQFSTIHRPNRWARMQGYYNMGRLSVLTVHKTEGLTDETMSNIKPMIRGKVPA